MDKLEINTWDDIKKNPEVLFNTDIYSDVITHKSDYCVDITGHNLKGHTRNESKIENAVLALLKINILIEYGYGGNVTEEEWKTLDDIYVILFDPKTNIISVYTTKPLRIFTHLAFHTYEQATRFISYPENQKLVADFYMTDLE